MDQHTGSPNTLLTSNQWQNKLSYGNPAPNFWFELWCKLIVRAKTKDGWLVANADQVWQWTKCEGLVSISEKACRHSIWTAQTGSHFKTFKVQGWTINNEQHLNGGRMRSPWAR